MIVQQDYLFWKLIQKLIEQASYRLIHLSEDHREVWLQPDHIKDAQLIRIKRFDIDWSNWLGRDIEEVLSTFETVRKQTFKRSLNVTNIYVSSFKPVDEWEFHIKKEKHLGKTTLKSMLITRDELAQTLRQTEEYTGIPLDELNGIVEDETLDYEMLHALKEKVITSVRKNIKQEQEIFEQGNPFFTKIFLTIQILLYVVLELFGGSTNTSTLITFGAKVNELIYQGEWWRFVTPIFLHIGFLHLVMNSLALYYIGMAVEKMYGSVRFLFIYMFAGVTGTMMSFIFSPSISAGASGAIFGLFGALLLLGLLKPNLFFRTIGPNILIVLAINLSFGFVVPNVDNAGHIGGLIGGFLAALAVQLPKIYKRNLRLIGFVSIFAFVIGLIYYGFEVLPKTNPAAAIAVSQNLIEEEKFEEAKNLLLEMVQSEKATPEISFFLSYTQIELGEAENAIRHLQDTVEKEPDYHPAYYLLSFAYEQVGNRQQAIESIERALELDPSNAEYERIYSNLRSS